MRVEKVRVGLLIAAGLAGVVFVLFGATLGYAFTRYDDAAQVVANPLVRSLAPANIARMFSSFSVRSYYPVRLLSLAIDYRLWGLWAGGYHFTNLLLHAANVLLLFGLALRLLGARAAGAARAYWAAALAASLLAVHPVVVEPVAWVGGREELLTLLFVLLGLHAHLLAVALLDAEPADRRSRTQRLLWRLLTVAACALACMSNVTGLLFVPLIAAHDALNLRPAAWRRSAGTYLPLLALAAAALVLKRIGTRLAFERGQFVAPAAHSALDRMLMTLNLYWLNIKSILWPRGLTLIYTRAVPLDVFRARALLGTLAAAATLGVLVVFRKRKSVVFGLLWFLVGLAPSSQIVPHHIFRADRFLYLPLAGLGLAVGAGLARLGQRSVRSVRPALAAACVALALCFTLSVFQRRVWADNRTLFAHVLKVTPDSAIGHHVLALSLRGVGKTQAAIEHLEQAVRLQPGYADAHDELGEILLEAGRYADAIRHFSRAAAVRPKCDEFRTDITRAHYRYANVLVARGRLRDATKQYRSALALNPALPEAAYNLANTLCKQGENTAARRWYRHALDINPDYVDARYNLGNLLAKQGKTGAAAEQYRHALRCAPNRGDIRTNLGNALLSQGDTEAAIRHYRKVLAVNPNAGAARRNLELALSMQRGEPEQ
ncbi:MAG: tetratricopeptide repeat protein [Kiritimatiellae bacterium]|nr:tetratricopeptide repeat protein [Kiritimatiellia bacterium]